MAKKPNRLIKRAVDAAGGIRALAVTLKVSYQAVYGWLYQGARVPAERVLELERASKRAVTRYQLRPDIYPPPKRRKAAPRATETAPAPPPVQQEPIAETTEPIV